MDLTSKKISNRIILTILAILVIVWFYPHRNINHFIYEEGRPWNYAQLIAPFDIPIHPDSATVRAVRDTLDARFVPIYKFDSTVIDSIVDKLPQSSHSSQLAHYLRSAYENGVVSSEEMEKIGAGRLPRVRILNGNVLSEESTSTFITPRDIYRKLDSLITDRALHDYFVSADLPDLLRSNVSYDEYESKRHYNNDYQTLTADRGVILQGQAIINKGAIVTAQDYTNLKTYETLLEQHTGYDKQSTLLNWLGQFLYVTILMGLLFMYCTLVEPRIFGTLKTVLFLITIQTLFFLASVWLSSVLPGACYIVPITIVPILVLVFFDSRTAFYVAVLTVLLIAPITAFSLEYIFLQLCACTMCIFTLKDLSRRSQLLRTACICAATYALCYLALELLLNGSLDGWSWRLFIFLMINSLLVSMAYILMFAAEKIFGFVSSVTLVELSDTNQPLLRQLSDICPGTFQHCIAVSNLASDAARIMGANEQLVRAGALYHDIGKIANPAFFTENQNGVNPHDGLTPENSAKIIINHVHDGLRMAEKEGLPEAIRKFIREHHGAGQAKYFYLTACNSAPDGVIPDPTDFTYPGPNPHSRETSLLMMADSVEAASRSLKDYSKESISALVDRIIDGQIADGLHNNSTLEFADIPKIKEAFVKRLMTMYHTRIAYPDRKSASPQQQTG